MWKISFASTYILPRSFTTLRSVQDDRKKRKNFVANAPLDDNEEWFKNKAPSHFQWNVFTFKGKPLKALLNALQSLPPQDEERCVALGYSSANAVRLRAPDNPLSSGWGSSLRFRVYYMVDRAKPVRPCHTDVVETCYRDLIVIDYWYKDTNFSPLLQVFKSLFHLYQDISGH